jgi:ABC-type transport system involved in multi-copper enzyme maturation permease subunit
MRLLSPVYGKELVQASHGWLLPALKAVVLALLLVVAAYAMMDRDQFSAARGLRLFAMLGMVTCGAVAVLTPLLVAGVVAGERQANTLSLLFLTRLSDWQIVQDKGLARLTLLAYLAALVAPFMVGTLLYGGVEPAQVVLVVANVAATALLAGGVSLLASARCRTPGRAIALAVGLVLIVLGGPVVVLEVLSTSRDVVILLSPFLAVPFACYWEETGRFVFSTSASVNLGRWLCLGPLVVGLVSYPLCVWLATLQLRRAPRRELPEPPAPVLVAPKDRLSWLERGLASDARGLWRRVRSRLPLLPRRPPENPVAWRCGGLYGGRLLLVAAWVLPSLWVLGQCFNRWEVVVLPVVLGGPVVGGVALAWWGHRRGLSWPLWIGPLLLLVGGAVAAVVIADWRLYWRPGQWWTKAIVYHALLLVRQVGGLLTLLAVAAMASASIAGERQRDTLGLLLATRMSAGRIMWGYGRGLALVLLAVAGLLVVLAVVEWVGALPYLRPRMSSPSGAMRFWVSAHPWPARLIGVAVLLAHGAVAAAVGLALSLISATPLRALTRTLFVLGAATVLLAALGRLAKFLEWSPAVLRGLRMLDPSV